MEKFKIVDDVMSKEELEKLDRKDFSEDIAEAVEKGEVYFAEAGTPWEETVKAIKERRKRSETRMASFRLPVWIIEGLKRNAAKGDVKYSEYVIETLAKAAI